MKKRVPDERSIKEAIERRPFIADNWAYACTIHDFKTESKDLVELIEEPKELEEPKGVEKMEENLIKNEFTDWLKEKDITRDQYAEWFRTLPNDGQVWLNNGQYVYYEKTDDFCIKIGFTYLSIKSAVVHVSVREPMHGSVSPIWPIPPEWEYDFIRDFDSALERLAEETVSNLDRSIFDLDLRLNGISFEKYTEWLEDIFQWCTEKSPDEVSREYVTSFHRGGKVVLSSKRAYGKNFLYDKTNGYCLAFNKTYKTFFIFNPHIHKPTYTFKSIYMDEWEHRDAPLWDSEVQKMIEETNYDINPIIFTQLYYNLPIETEKSDVGAQSLAKMYFVMIDIWKEKEKYKALFEELKEKQTRFQEAFKNYATVTIRQ